MNTWKPITKLPPLTERNEEMRCVVVWRDLENPEDVGVEITTLYCIWDGDYADKPGAVWRSVMDAPPFKRPSNRKRT